MPLTLPTTFDKSSYEVNRAIREIAFAVNDLDSRLAALKKAPVNVQSDTGLGRGATGPVGPPSPSGSLSQAQILIRVSLRG